VAGGEHVHGWLKFPRQGDRSPACAGCRLAECYDLGGDEGIPLLESLAGIWIDLAMVQGQGREIAFKLLKR
jgi:hypothetical protein